ncbi:MAG: PD-(D/E)XK nuclease family protein [Spirochaetia bacterium]
MSSVQAYPRYVEAVIADCIGDSRKLFVFPSEVVAESWHLRVLETGAAKAVRRDNFVSWDRLKERYFSPRRDNRPSNLIFRTFFASDLLTDKGRESFPFEELVNPEYPEQAPRFTRWISSLLPQLKTAVSIIEMEGDALPGPFIRDMQFLYGEYSRFLSDSGLFEPSWQEPDPRGFSGKVHLFFPELIEDFDQYRSLLREDAGFFVYSMDSLGNRSPHTNEEEAAAEKTDEEKADEEKTAAEKAADAEPLAPGIVRFSSAWKELEYVLDTISGLLASGTAPADIAVTLPAYESWMPYLKEGAVLRGIPLQFRSGSPLTTFPAGRLFRNLKDLVESGFSLSAMKNLFLDPVYPWRRREQWREMIAFGIEHSCVRTFRGPEGFYDPWKIKLEKAGRKRLKGLYEAFTLDLKAVLNSSSFGELNAQMVGFLTSWFDDSLWRPKERKVLQYALLQLREAADAETSLEGIDLSGSGEPYSLWLSILDQRVYVPRETGAGVPVYRYRVAAGSYPVYHFIAGAGQEETRCVFDSLSFLREDRRGGITGGSKDLSAPFLEAYMSSGHRVFCSCSDAGFGGPQLPPAEFLSPEASAPGAMGKVVRAESLERGESSEDRADGAVFDLYRAEREGWSGTADFPRYCYPIQFEGYSRMRMAGLSSKGSDYTEDLIEEPSLINSVLEVVRKENDIFRFSPRSLDTYRACGFAFFLNYALGIEEEEYETAYEDYFVTGMLTHRVFQLFFGKIVEDGGVFEPEKRDIYRGYLKEVLAESVAEYEEEGLDLFPPEWRRVIHLLEERLALFPEEESAAFPHFMVKDLEKKHWVDLPGGVGFSGRIDRISTLNGRPAVVDYKSGEEPKKKNYSAPNGGVPEQTQMPIYLLLAEEGQREAAAVSYYSVRKSAYTHLLYDGPGEFKETLGREELCRIAEEVAEEARRVRGRIEAGDFTVPEDCNPCEFRPVCRVKYSIRGGK